MRHMADERSGGFSELLDYCPVYRPYDDGHCKKVCIERKRRMVRNATLATSPLVCVNGELLHSTRRLLLPTGYKPVVREVGNDFLGGEM